MKRLFVIIVIACSVFTARAADASCGGDSVCIEKDRAKRFLEAAKQLRCMQKQLERRELKLEAESYRIIVDDDGRSIGYGVPVYTPRITDVSGPENPHRACVGI